MFNQVNDPKYGTSDEELKNICKSMTRSIKVIGCGPAGCSFISNCVEWNMHGLDLYALGNDIHQLDHINSPNKILLGPTSIRRLYENPRSLFREGFDKVDEIGLREIIHGSEIVFVTGAMGDGSATYLVPTVSKIARSEGALTIAYVTRPFSWEGNGRTQEADIGVRELLNMKIPTIVVKNDHLLKIVPRLPPYAQFRVAMEGLMNLLKGVVDIITRLGLVNMDLRDFEAVFSSGGLSYVGVGKSNGDDRICEIVDEAMSSGFIEMDPSGVHGALINIVGGEDMSVGDAERVVELISERINPNAQVIWGARVDPCLERTLEILAIMV